ncbi:abc bile acid transporter [Trichoderma arundinaceum]|uniref:Abc bile acid transporter n=1 Tax=Trichoderma arundinaceum TaxID=490622 RepID=A0A395NXE3_TRIAR|nr:abc bile acid transporter [Trichoderma arundinaceum]
MMETVTANWLHWVTQMRLQMPVIALLNALVFEKNMRRQSIHETAEPPDQTKGRKKKGQQTASSSSSLADIITNDSSNVAQFCSHIHYFLIASFKILFEVVYLSRHMGITSILTGAASAVILFPFSATLSKKQRSQQIELSKAHATLSNLVSEALQGLRRIRLSSMERIWQRRIIDAREQELSRIWKSEITLAFLTLAANLGPILLASVALSVYSFQVGYLSPAVAFASLNFFNNLHEAFSQLPLKAAAMHESWISLQRIQKYLDGPEQIPSAMASDSIDFDGATLAWAHNSNTELLDATGFKLRGVNLAFPKGKLSIITGKTGSGKSLLVASMLEEATIQSGRLGKPVTSATEEKDMSGMLDKNIALVSQPPWIENCTVRDNIIFGYDFNEARYRNVLHACALDQDLSLLSDGDMTKAGVNGAVLSGGQKWRVALARALYSPSEILILEDVLSTVDSSVAQWIYEHALTGELVEGRTRILVTHHPESLIFSSIGLAASRTLFNNMVSSVLAAPLSWIDSTPMGQVLHSLGGDLYQIDHRTTQVVIGILSTLLHLMLILLTTFKTAPYTALLTSQRPMLEHANSAATGLLTIRAFAKTKSYVERSFRDLNCLAETPRETEEGEDAPEGWPKEGAVQVQGLGIRYGSDLRSALNGISFSINPRQRLGIVGRTGAGKTSLTSALLRFIDASEGRILIDGIDISTLKLGALRAAVAIIPQDPFLFLGTLRSNLDLREDKTDAELLSVLRRVQLISDVHGGKDGNKFSDLAMEIHPGGENLSHGQRQLICLARALLSRCRILILDEATSAVDGATDAMIQQVIREEFAYATILVVAHRLLTVADSDAILVLQNGEMAEFGSPAELMAKEGVFWDMVRHSGDAEKIARMIQI